MKGIYNDYHASREDERIAVRKTFAFGHASEAAVDAEDIATESKYAMLRRIDKIVNALELIERFREGHRKAETVPTIHEYGDLLDAVLTDLEEGIR